jgi:alginate O-acetyltransferase complex protein AlgI
MPFSTLLFVCEFLPICLLVHAIVFRKWRNAVALGFSLLFYAWGAPRFLPIVLSLGVLDFFLARAIAATDATRTRRRKGLVAAGICVHVSVLLYFKYSNFAVSELNGLRSTFGAPALHWVAVVLPIGISFLTFEEISYLVDVYRGDGQPARRWDHYLLFLMLFPHSIAGPIFRWKDLRAQLDARDVSIRKTLDGFTRFSLGLAKKVLVADSVAFIADRAFDLGPWELTAQYAWVGVLAYSVQIYFDFSGYSDMAIGLGKMLGFDFRENFREPYSAVSLADFWTRWHISLSSWLRDYLYIPLGGNRSGRMRAELNALFVFFVCGLWHGAAWTFVVWGLYHGALVGLERRFSARLEKTHAFVRGLGTFFVVVVGWVFFRSRDLKQAWSFLAAMFGGGHATVEPWAFPAEMMPRIAVLFLVGALAWLLLRLAQATRRASDDRGATLPAWAPSPLWSFALLLLSIAHMTNSQYTPLIYFTF